MPLCRSVSETTSGTNFKRSARANKQMRHVVKERKSQLAEACLSPSGMSLRSLKTYSKERVMRF